MQSVYTPVTHRMIAVRTGPVNSYYSTCFIEEWRHEGGALICDQFWTAAMMSNYMRSANSRTCQSILVRDGEYLRIFWKMIYKRQQILVLSCRYWVRPSNINSIYLKWTYGISNVVNSWFLLRRWQESILWQTFLPISAFRATRTLERVIRRCVSLRGGLRKRDHDSLYHVLN